MTQVAANCKLIAKNFLSRDRKHASTPDADMEDDQNGYCMLTDLVLCCCAPPTSNAFLMCVFVLRRSDCEDQHVKIKCFRYTMLESSSHLEIPVVN